MNEIKLMKIAVLIGTKHLIIYKLNGTEKFNFEKLNPTSINKRDKSLLCYICATNKQRDNLYKVQKIIENSMSILYKNNRQYISLISCDFDFKRLINYYNSEKEGNNDKI
jgi:hypothetical protein